MGYTRVLSALLGRKDSVVLTERVLSLLMFHAFPYLQEQRHFNERAVSDY